MIKIYLGIYLFLAIFITLVSSYIAERRTNNIDIYDTFVSEKGGDKFVVDVVIFIPSLIMFLMCKWQDIVDFIFLYSTLMIIRAFVMQATIFPTLNKEITNTDLFKMNGNNDYMYSGHTCYLVIALCILISKKFIPLWQGIILGVLYALASGYLMATLRCHYSADIVVAWLVSILLFLLYKTNKKKFKFLSL